MIKWNIEQWTSATLRTNLEYFTNGWRIPACVDQSVNLNFRANDTRGGETTRNIIVRRFPCAMASSTSEIVKAYQDSFRLLACSDVNHVHSISKGVCKKNCVVKNASSNQHTIKANTLNIGSWYTTPVRFYPLF